MSSSRHPRKSEQRVSRSRAGEVQEEARSTKRVEAAGQEEEEEEEVRSPDDKVKVVEVLSNESGVDVSQSLGNTTEVMRMLPLSIRDNQIKIRSSQASSNVRLMSRDSAEIKEVPEEEQPMEPTREEENEVPQTATQ